MANKVVFYHCYKEALEIVYDWKCCYFKLHIGEDPDIEGGVSPSPMVTPCCKYPTFVGHKEIDGDAYEDIPIPDWCPIKEKT